MTMFQNLHRSMGPADTLEIVCEGCGRRASWRQAEAFRKLGSDATPADIRRRLVCTGCGQRGGARVWI
jgi:hypothetical protein